MLANMHTEESRITLDDDNFANLEKHCAMYTLINCQHAKRLDSELLEQHRKDTKKQLITLLVGLKRFRTNALRHKNAVRIKSNESNIKINVKAQKNCGNNYEYAPLLKTLTRFSPIQPANKQNKEMTCHRAPRKIQVSFLRQFHTVWNTKPRTFGRPRGIPEDRQ